LGSKLLGVGARFFAPGILCLLVAAPACAGAQKMTLPQIVNLSLRENGGLKAFRQEKGIHEAEREKADLLPNPVLELEGATGALTGSPDENSLGLGLSQEFLLGDKRAKRRAVAELELELYRWQLAERERVLRERVASAFYDALLAEGRRDLNARVTALNRQLLEVTGERLAVGDIPELEMNLVKLELARGENAGIEVERSVVQNRARLAAAIGVPAAAAPELIGSLDAQLSLGKSLAELKQTALSARPDLKTLAAEKSKGEAELVLARADAISNLTAGVTLRRDSTSTEIGGLQAKDTAYTVGVRLSMPLPVFDRNQAGLSAARAKLQSAQTSWVAAALGVEGEVEEAYAALLNSDKTLSLYRTGIIPQLAENLSLTQEAYRLGEVGILAVLAEQRKFFEVNDGYLAAQHARQSALVKLEAAVATELNGGMQ
jgi:outer membrane protein, heavy metal efflux system